jgi:hypothetical protein
MNGRGKVAIYHGTGDGHFLMARVLDGALADTFFGFSVAGIGDANGDGYGDLAIAAPGEASNGIRFSGTVRVYYGSSDGINSVANVTLSGEQNAFLGIGLIAGADLNGDGFSDVAVSATTLGDAMPRHRSTQYIFNGSANGVRPIANTTLRDDVDSTAFGIASGVGDFNADGFPDLWIGNVNSKLDVISNAARVAFYSGSMSGLLPERTSTISDGDGVGRNFGARAAVGDFNLDGFDDWVSISETPMQPTRILAFAGGPTGVTQMSQRVVMVPSIGSNPVDRSFVAIGDHDGDGRLDWVRRQTTTVSGASREEIGVIGTLAAGGFATVTSGSFLLPVGSDVSVLEN